MGDYKEHRWNKKDIISSGKWAYRSTELCFSLEAFTVLQQWFTCVSNSVTSRFSLFRCLLTNVIKVCWEKGQLKIALTHLQQRILMNQYCKNVKPFLSCIQEQWGCIWGLHCWACIPSSQHSVYLERGQTGCRRHRALSKTKWTRWYGANISEKNAAPCTHLPWKRTVSAGQSPEREGKENQKCVRQYWTEFLRTNNFWLQHSPKKPQNKTKQQLPG